MLNDKCHVFTPKHIVNKMLDEVGYIKKLYGKRFLENSCGDGQILCEAIIRYINDCINLGISEEKIVKGLERDFVGVELDKNNYESCIKNLNDIAELFKLSKVKWNIINSDFLKFEDDIKFDFIVGNPPYISYANIDRNNRKYIRDNFESCKKGKFDYCYPFIECSLKHLKSNGMLAYLIPTNIFKNVFAKDLRMMLLDKIVKIFDYTTEKIFKNVLTSSSIIICKADNDKCNVTYCDISNKKESLINKATLSDKWIFSNKKQLGKVLFSEYFLAATSVATLLNEAFVIKEYDEREDGYFSNSIFIERGILRPAASPRALSRGVKELIIFPYRYQDEKLVRFDIKYLKKNYPGALKYLEKYKNKLDLRDSDPSSKWYEYGRTQALDNLNQKKLLMSFIVTNRVNIYELDKSSIPYSGIYITPKSNLDLSIAKEILESDEFLEYVKKIGIYISGSSLRITANDIKNFDISNWREK